ncbi:hypothetical protein GALMADRAFT_209381 [Galerina marginata CBS 339.88]|uniref:Yeast cell wall synthesis Kre9/Knh1-like N-terminal domain-containing protein n=1 Tax=Galerina marginata (strain CBS 339.88) TaxID=685588 RepID=A0A067T3W3_GALM3|nr:hypothetical protein GALMADRAFT_209381 [Galerina marginata CBS 339.88]
MYAKLNTSLLTVLVPLVTALLVSVPKNHIALGEAVTFTWDFTPNVDPTTFSLALINQDQNTKYVLSDNIDSTTEQVTFAMPIFIPVGDNYIFEASRVFETIGIIHIGPGDASLTNAGAPPTVPTP